MIKFRTRSQLRKYLHGEGVEIGALQEPLDLNHLNVSQIFYVDRLSNDDLRTHYPEMNGLPLVHVDIVDDGSTLASLPDNSLDFIIANHVFEHLDNPIRALKNWYNHLRPNGILFLAVPDKRFTFDKERSLTSLQHFLDDYNASDDDRLKRDHSHFVETAEIIEKRTGADAEERVADLIARHYSIHYHTWDFLGFRAFIRHICTEIDIPFTIVDYSHVLPGKEEFIFILGKQVMMKRTFWGGLVPIFPKGYHNKDQD